MTPGKGSAQTAEKAAVRGQHRAGRHGRRSVVVLERETEHLAARVQALERENAALEAFAGVAAHELVEPLVIAEAYATMVAERLRDGEHAESQRDLAALARTVSRTRLLLEALLHDARTTDDHLADRSVDLGEVVAGCVDLLGQEVAARGASVHVGDLPTVSGNESLLNGLFTNLLMNALKYSPRYGAEIAIDSEREDAEWRVWIDSEGPTIPVEDRERIFNAYQRGTGERRARGAGLGLAICSRIVERHGGRIGVDPAPGGGNRFYFTLPARD
jgi:light-regulated signal transduction histidine kinase (bacteriophytochrome)